jgi:hypothetical protein
MDWKEIKDSSMIKRIAYKDNILYVTFNNDSVYEYYNVDKQIFYNLHIAESVGKYFCKNIKNIYEYKKLD